MMIIPVIGITLDSEQPGSYSNFPWYALRENYIEAVSHAGGLPLALPHEMDWVDEYLDLIDGLVVTGGNFDVDPALFGDKKRHSSVTTKKNRTHFEIRIIKGALERNMPILGICGGQQLLHVVLGGRLIQHIPDTNYWHYTLQLNIYKYILETKYGFNVKDLHLVVIHPDNVSENYEKIKLPHLKENDIMTILN